tara:strand:- start:192 stop:437 length:246 start_codon:yes stop_codon:yes gene_type:complete
MYMDFLTPSVHYAVRHRSISTDRLSMLTRIETQGGGRLVLMDLSPNNLLLIECHNHPKHGDVASAVDWGIHADNVHNRRQK